MTTARTTHKPDHGKHPKYKAGKRVRRSGRAPAFYIGIGVVLVIGIAAVFALAGGSKPSKSEAPASAALVKTVTSVPANVFNAVGQGSAAAAPRPINGAALASNGKPQVLYVGAEYCPYCATERWPMVVALSRFGTFAGLKTTHSSSTDVYANTNTFSFNGASYTSPWIAFTGVETASNQQQGDGYKPLQPLTPAQQQIFSTYDQPPYVSSQSSGGIPFIDFGGKYMVDGVTYDPGVLQGKSLTEIANSLADPQSKISQGAIGVANTFTAAICKLTHNQPANVCNATVQQIEASL
jgi:hypothetical protein